MTEKMKPSGIAWIGDIPQGWNIKRVKYLASLKGRIGWQGLTSDEYIDEGPYLITGVDFQNGGIDWSNCVHISEERWAEAPEIHIQNGDLLITKDGTVGKVAIVSGLEGKASLNSGVLLIRTNPDFDKRFLFWVLQSEEFWTWFRLKNAGNSTIVHLYQGDFAEFSYTFPNTTEQCAIANFLDTQCAKIDSVIADTEKQIETLQKYKKSLIIETITNRKANWKYGRIKDLMSLQRGHDLPQEEFVSGNVPVYGSNGVIGYHNIPTTAGPCVTIGRSGSVGALNYVNCDFWAHNTAIFIANSKGNHIRYLYYVLQSFDIKELANGSAVPTLDRKKVEGVHLYFTLDPIEQREIANYLDTRIAKFNEIIDVKQLQLETIRQHKKSLIYEYVTGKKRVTEVN